ncbi:MAG TPA: hypothetical protein VD905_01900 [Flavobacteriales bacterium]|nr:hypothetical protein [Flavobacteriales bacterium]
MGLQDQIQKDIAQITTDTSAFGISLDFTAPNGQTASITGTHTKHHFGITDDGNVINSKKVVVAFSESVLLKKNPSYPIRNAKGEVDLNKHKVKAKDSTGTLVTYIMRAFFPDEQCGLVVCLLDGFE